VSTFRLASVSYTDESRQSKALQASLMEIVDRVEVVKNEHEKLEGGNRFLQS
jgi:hypothetical protein